MYLWAKPVHCLSTAAFDGEGLFPSGADQAGGREGKWSHTALLHVQFSLEVAFLFPEISSCVLFPCPCAETYRQQERNPLSVLFGSSFFSSTEKCCEGGD